MSDIIWTNVRVRLGDLKPWSDNPRLSTKAQARRLLASFDKFGQVQTVAVDCDGNVLDGHQRLSALLTIHDDKYELDARQSSRPLTDAERRELVISLHSGAVGGWDWQTLSSWNADEVKGWMGADFLKEWKKEVDNDANNIKEWMQSEQADGADAPVDVDRAAELLEKWQVKPGDLWQIGEHRLICGDCTDAATVARVMDGERADMVYFDPPYGMNLDVSHSADGGEKDGWVAKPKNYEPVIGDDADFDPAPLMDMFSYCKEQFWWGADYYAERIPNRKDGSWLVWDKRAGVEDMKLTFSEFELCWSKTKHLREIARITWSGLLGTEQEFDHKRHHPTQKPIKLAAWFIEKFSKESGIVVDFFLGSAPTLVACENLGRKCRAVEISPAYVAVALERMSQAFPSLPIHRLDAGG
jgi:hypothetical protein